MITLDDLAAAVRARLEAAPEFAAAVPGGAWLGRADEAAAAPYAVFTVELDGDPELSSDGSYLQAATVRAGVYADQGESGHDPQAVQLGLAKGLNAAPTAWPALRDGRVVHCLPRGFDGKFAPRLRDGRDVFLVGGRWGLLVEGNTAP